MEMRLVERLLLVASPGCDKQEEGREDTRNTLLDIQLNVPPGAAVAFPRGQGVP